MWQSVLSLWPNTWAEQPKQERINISTHTFQAFSPIAFGSMVLCSCFFQAGHYYHCHLKSEQFTRLVLSMFPQGGSQGLTQLVRLITHPEVTERLKQILSSAVGAPWYYSCPLNCSGDSVTFHESPMLHRTSQWCGLPWASTLHMRLFGGVAT